MQVIGAPKPTHSDMTLIPAQGRDPEDVHAGHSPGAGGGGGHSQ